MRQRSVPVDLQVNSSSETKKKKKKKKREEGKQLTMTTTDKSLAVGATILFALLATTAIAEAAPKHKKKQQEQVEQPAAAPAPAPAPATALPPKADETSTTTTTAAQPASSNARPKVKEKAEEETEEEESDDEVAPSGFTMGARAGYALPMGSISKDQGSTDLSRVASGMAPFWIDMGYRIAGHWYVGGYFQLGIIATSGEVCKGTASCSSSGTDIRFGGIAKYIFRPNAKITPWLGISSGYEIINLSVTGGQASRDSSAKGWEFIGLHVGGDFRVSKNVSLGPSLMASFGQYSSVSSSGTNEASTSRDFTNTALHEWVFFGANGRFDL
jgi:hypothetical protein